MESNIPNAFLLLAVGMVTVFAVLSLVVLSGNILIWIINKYAPDIIPEPKLKVPAISNKQIAVMTAVVDHITSGRGKIEHIEKVK